MKKLLLALSALTLTPSCAALFTGTTDEIRVTSEPAGMYFRTNFGHLGQTPALIDVPCDEPVEVTYFGQGYADQKLRIDTHMSPWIWGNLFTAGLGIFVDVAGPGFTHEEDSVHATFEGAPQLAQPGAVDSTPRPTPEATALGGEREHVPSVEKESFAEWAARQGKEE